MNYYRITIPIDNGENIMMSVENLPVRFNRNGISIKDEVEAPVKITMYADEEYGYDQYDPFFEGEIKDLTIEERLLDYYEQCIMSKKLVDLLLSAGVDNLELFPALIEDHETKEILELPYFYVNIVGILPNGGTAPISNEKYLDAVQIDESLRKGKKIFTMMEARGEIIIEESLALLIKDAELKGIDVEPVGKRL